MRPPWNLKQTIWKELFGVQASLTQLTWLIIAQATAPQNARALHLQIATARTRPVSLQTYTSKAINRHLSCQMLHRISSFWGANNWEIVPIIAKSNNVVHVEGRHEGKTLDRKPYEHSAWIPFWVIDSPKTHSNQKDCLLQLLISNLSTKLQ